MNETRPYNYVPAEPQTIDMPRADLVRRSDVVNQVGRLLDVYDQQQRAALATAQQDVQRGGYLSTAEQVKERRQVSKMYLRHYALVSGMTMGGLCTLAWSAGVVGNITAFAAWLALTGITTLGLAWVRHGDEFKHSPEGIARHLADWHGSIAEYEAETRRLSIQWEFGAERERQQAAAQAAADARQQAQLRIEEIGERRRMVEAQTERRYQADDLRTLRPRMATPAPRPVQDVTATASAAPIASTGGGVAGDDTTWQRDLFDWVAGLYDESATTSAMNLIKGRVLWAQRSEWWTERERAQARRVCVDIRPAIIEACGNDGKRWRLCTEFYGTADLALMALKQRISD